MFRYLVIIIAISIQSYCIPIQTTTTESNLDNNKNETTTTKSIDLIVKQQTDTIKKIVAEQSLQDTLREEPIKEISLDELKIRCQHFAKLFNNINRTDNTFIQNKNDRIEQITYTSKLNNHKPMNLQKRPVYIQPNIIARVPMIQKTNGFYVTTQPTTTTTTTTKKPTTPVPLQHSIKYIRLEPVILQKTILNDGRTIYYWHRSLPTAVQYSTNNRKMMNEDVKNTTEMKKYDTTTTRTTTSTTTPSSSSSSSSYYDFRNLFPSFYNARYEIPPATSTTTTTTTTSTTTPTTPKIQEQQNDELLYTHQLRFVVPVPYENSDKTTLKHPLDFDQFAYYPKVLQPSTINVPVPYTPTFQMIKTLTVPNIDYMNGGGGTINQAEHKQ